MDIKHLREETGAGVMECKKALEESKGDLEKARAVIQERGAAGVAKREGRDTGAGLIVSYTHNGRIGVLVDLRAETDFVVRSEPFKELAHELVLHIAAAAPADVDELMEQLYVRDESKTIAEVVRETIAKVGENIRVNSFCRLET